jgi:ribosome production factor 1
MSDQQPAIFIQIPAKPHPKTVELQEELILIIPNSYKADSNIESASANDQAITIKIQEDLGPNFLIFTSKENQFVFKIIEYRSRASIGVTSPIKQENHQLVLSKFTTDLGLKVAGFFMTLFPINLESNQVVNFSVHRDFIFFRMYRTCITKKGPIFEKLGPHLSLRLWRITDYVDDSNEETEKKIYNFKKYVKNINLL